VDLRVLGPVEAWAAGTPLDLGSRKQRLVLAVLLLEANRLVPVDRLVDLVWESAPPPSARGTVQVLVSRLRAAFRQGGPEIAGQGSGYLLRVDPAAVDVHRFTDLIGRAAQADDEGRVELLGEALALWRGDPLADVAPAEVADRLCAGLRETRWTAVEDLFEARVRLGESRRVLDELPTLVAENPVRQRLVGQLMLALHREGRTSEALDAYRALRDRLVTEFGLDPAPELRDLEAAILRADPGLDPARPQPVRPAELPHDARGFVGRERELDRLDTAAGGIWVISGTAGVGKTALALRWAHRSRGRFPDGQLYVNLRGFDAEHQPLAPSAALAQLLRGLGADPRAVPSDLDGQAKLYRSMMADRNALLVLDDARDVAQVSPLIPPTGAVVVTSRNRLGELVALGGARALPLDVLPPEDSMRLLEAALGADQVAAEPSAAAELTRLCGHLPLALRIAAANIGTAEEPEITHLVAELTEGNPLAGLSVDGAEDGPVAKAISLSYRALAPEQRRLFRRLGLVPGQTFTAEAVGAAASLPTPVASRQLRALTSVHLVERHARDRYRSHDLLRRYAVDRAAAEDPPEVLAEARERLYEHYLTTADAAGRRLIPHFLRLPRPAPDETRFPDGDAALAWLDAEWTNLTAAVTATAQRGPYPFSWHLTDALRAYFHQRGHHGEWLAAATTALAAARAAGDGQAQAAMHQSIALACVNNSRYDEAATHLASALRRNVDGGWAEGEAAVLNNLSAVHQRLGAPQEAITCGLRSLELCEQQGNQGGIAMALANVGFAYWQLGSLEEARTYFGRALKEGEQADARFSLAVLLVDLGNVHRDLGDDDAAEEFYARALEANQTLGYRYGEATALAGRALLRCRTGLTDRTRAEAEHAVELTVRIGDRGTQAWTLNALGAVCLRLGAADDAVRHHRQALDIAREVSFRWCETEALAGLAEAALRRGEPAEARDHGEQALAGARRSGYRLIERRARAVLAEAG
jgi:DNA-binding SARP family transcriptional activator/tetratricopeptide (TPR) repeat protein